MKNAFWYKATKCYFILYKIIFHLIPFGGLGAEY